MRLFNKISRRQAITDDEARRLTEMFLDGATEPAQEQELYTYYAGRNVADDLKCYRDMFAMYASLTPRSAAGKSSRRPYIPAAAAVAVLAVVGAYVFSAQSSLSGDNGSVYAGSYIIRDGKKITDLKRIMPTLHRADNYVDSLTSSFDELYPDDTETAILEKALAGITDPQLKAELLANI